MLNYQLNNWNRNLSLLLFLCLFSFPIITNSQNLAEQKTQLQTSFVYKELCNPNPSPEAKALYRYLQNLFGEKILSGQMSTQGGINEIEYISDITGKKPAICGFDLEFENANETKIQKAIEWWKTGGIPLIMWNWAAPTFSEGYDNSKKEIDIEKCFQEGTPEYKSFWNELETKANHLEKLRDAKVPVLWCPFQEQTGKLFWWSKQGPAQFIKLWQTMFNYFVKERNLNNLIWVQCFSEDIDRAWFPGNSYVDVIATSSYKEDSKPHTELFNKARIIANSNITPIAFNECATIPDPDECRKTDAMWSWWMERPAPYLT
ncbi:MAG TPA: glycosyl hydrolase, partial [Draconibacterium sp.]|nr:glycosyl hydrolase [Draconibacterium sp.]